MVRWATRPPEDYFIVLSSDLIGRVSLAELQQQRPFPAGATLMGTQSLSLWWGPGQFELGRVCAGAQP